MIDIGAFLKTFIYVVSASLLYPVLFLLVAATVASVSLAGAVASEWLERRRLLPLLPQDMPSLLQKKDLERELAWFVSGNVRQYLLELEDILKTGKPIEEVIEAMLQRRCMALEKSMDKLRILIRLGPSLGLLGTLIPMGTGLAALGQGDMTRLSADLVIAFTTTVTGLATGSIAYVLHTFKRRWIDEDVMLMEVATEIMASRNSNTSKYHEIS